MKILFFHPSLRSEDPLFGRLQTQGVAMLFAETQSEAWGIFQLHRRSIDLGVIHREGKDSREEGLALVRQLQAEGQFKDLPLILTTEDWDEVACASHQESPEGLNAYLHFPYSSEQLISVIEAVLGPLASPEQDLHVSLAEGSSSSIDLSQSISLVLAGQDLEPAEVPKTMSQEASSPLLSVVEGQQGADRSPSVSLVSLSLETSADSKSVGALSLASEVSAELPKISASHVPVISGESQSPTISPALQENPDLFKIGSATTFSPSGSSDSGRAEPLFNLEDRPALSLESSHPDMGNVLADPIQPEKLLEQPIFETKEATISKFSVTEFLLHHPIGDAVVPGGAAHTPDLEVMKKYLILREQDVAALSHQLKEARDRLAGVEQLLLDEKTQNEEKDHRIREQQGQIDQLEIEKKGMLETSESQMTELRFAIKSKTDKVKALEIQLADKVRDFEQLKDRVRIDIRKIRVREKDLENKLEIAKKDSEVLMTAREVQLTELKRKIDILEFNMDLLQDQYNREKEHVLQFKERLTQLAQVVRLAEGLLDVSAVRETLANVDLAQKGSAT